MDRRSAHGLDFYDRELFDRPLSPQKRCGFRLWHGRLAGYLTSVGLLLHADLLLGVEFTQVYANMAGARIVPTHNAVGVDPHKAVRESSGVRAKD